MNKHDPDFDPELQAAPHPRLGVVHLVDDDASFLKAIEHFLGTACAVSALRAGTSMLSWTLRLGILVFLVFDSPADGFFGQPGFNQYESGLRLRDQPQSFDVAGTCHSYLTPQNLA
jgi:hypothetical protein